jgi:hypothetical protein
MDVGRGAARPAEEGMVAASQGPAVSPRGAADQDKEMEEAGEAAAGTSKGKEEAQDKESSDEFEEGEDPFDNY